MKLIDIQRQIEEFSGAVGPPDDPRERKRRRIVEAATELFTRHGYRRVSVDEIAQQAQVAKGTVYLYFQNKADLLLHAVAEEKKRYLSRMTSIFAPGVSPRERLKECIRLALVMSGEMPLISSLLGGEREILIALEELDPEERKRLFAFQTEGIAQLLAEAIAPHRLTAEQLHERADVVISLLYSSRQITEERARRGVPLDRYADVLAGMLVDGIAFADATSGAESGRKVGAKVAKRTKKIAKATA
jgi:TetR/AcrR family transcriptional regulator, cholesterol catabolism regulator